MAPKNKDLLLLAIINNNIMKLKNKVALITGSSRGIGKAIAILFAKEGANIVVNYFDSVVEAEKVVTEIESLGVKAIKIQADVSKEEQVKNMVSQAIKAFGQIDILINNAGIVFDIPFFERTVEQWERTLNTNLIGTFLCSKYVSQLMLKNKQGKIVNISSTNGINSFSPDSVDYDSSKAGIIILTRNLAKQLAPDIQVNTVAPGWVNTDMNKNLPKELIKEEIKKTYLGRFAEPVEIAKAVLFLASEDADYITGSILKVDGGHD